jgi:hypothetical protein
MIVSGTVLPFIGLVGLIGNTFVVAVYLNAEQRRHSTSIYLGALVRSLILFIINYIN